MAYAVVTDFFRHAMMSSQIIQTSFNGLPRPE
jgi:hypothetical protein